MKFIKIFILSLVFPVVAFSQSAKRDMADKYFGYLDFSNAAPMYNELASKNAKKFKKGKAVDWEVIRRAAQSSYYIRKYDKASKWYELALQGKAATTDDLKAYFESLRYSGNYGRANAIIDTLIKLDSADAKILEYKLQTNYFNYLKNDSASFSVKKMPFNKNLGDFSPVYHEEGLVYASARRKGSLNREYGWDNLAFLDLYYVKKKNGEYPKKSKLLRKSYRSSVHDGPVFYSKDGKTAFLTRNRKEKDARRGEYIVFGIYILQKGDDGKWGELQPFHYNSKDYSVGHVALSPDENTMYFASDMPGGLGGVDIWKSEKQGGGWSKPVNLGKIINTTDNEMFPYISQDGTLYFASKGHVGLGGLDIFESRKLGDGFSHPVNLGYPLNTQYDDFGLITLDGKTGFFSSDRNDYVDRIWSVEMPNRKVFDLRGKVSNEMAKSEHIKNADVVIKNITLGDSILTKTNADGDFFAPLLAESDYVVTASKPNYKSGKPVTLTTKGLTESTTLTAQLYVSPDQDKIDLLIPEDFMVDSAGNKVEIVRPRDPGEGLLVVKVLDCETAKPVVGIKLILQDIETGVESRITTNENGEIIIRQAAIDLPLSREFAIINEALEMSANGFSYLPTVKKVYFIFRGNEPNMTITKTVCLNNLKEDDFFELKDIYYDFDKATLRPASIVQLDKAYDFLMRNQNVKVELSSHTDSRASHAYNINLSQRRAQACVDYLTKVRGLSAGRIVAKGYGEIKLVNECSDGVECTPEQHQMNRRTEIRILKLN